MSSRRDQIQNDTDKIGVMLCGHGSRSDDAVAEFAQLARRLQSRLSKWPFEYGYLEFADPIILSGLTKLKERGCRRILAIPGMLLSAGHVKNDLPTLLATAERNLQIDIDYGRPLDVDNRLLRAAGDRIKQACDEADEKFGSLAKSDICLVVVGRGSSDPDANGDVAKITRMLWEGMGFGWSCPAYSGVTFPLVEPCLEHVAKLGYRRVIVFPYFLFTGILIDRIYGFVDRIAKRFSDIQWIKAPYLNDHSQIVDCFVERVDEILSGSPHMNCSLCKYRDQILGFEDEQGQSQTSHHHHVEGQGANAPGSNVADCPLCDNFCTGECRLQESQHHEHRHASGSPHHHHHHPYKHADHPLGPLSVLKSKK